MSDSDSSPKVSSSSSSSDDEKRRQSAAAAAGTPDPDSPGAGRHHSSDESASSSDGVLVELPSSHDHDARLSPGDPDGGILVGIDGSMHDNEGDRAEREDDFVDAPDQLGSTRSVDLAESLAMLEFGESSAVRLDDVVAECRKYKAEREVFGRLVVSLRQELEGLIDGWRNDDEVLERLPQMERDGGEERTLLSPTPLHSMLDDCSKSVYQLKSVMNEQLNSEATIRELHALLYAKDREIEDLSASVAESLVSRDVVVSYLSSVRDVHSEFLRESYDEVVGRLSASLASVVGLEDSSFLGLDTDRISLVEKQTLVLIEKHERVLSEIQQLGQCLAEVRADFMITEVNEPNHVFSITRDELLESKRKEIYHQEMMNRLEEENRKLFEEVDRMKVILVEVNAETSKTKAELEQAENKLAMAKEKLSIAVTKGKSLVQHRDSLKQSLAVKSSELEKCMLELQQKSETLVASESRFEEVKQSLEEKTRDLEKCMLELQQKSEALLTVEARVEELKQSLEDKTGELNKCLVELQLKSAALVAAEASKVELNRTHDLLNSLQESLSHRERIIGEIEEVVSLADSPGDMLPMDVVDRVKWLVDKKRISEGISLESCKIKDALSSIDLPEDISSMDVESQIDWLGKSLSQAKDVTVKLQGEISSYHIALEAHESEFSESRKEIDRLATSLLEEKQEKDSLQDEITDLRSKYEEISEKFSLVSKEKDGLMKVLLEISGSTLADEFFVDTNLMIEKCMEKVKERSKTAPIETEKFERMQSLLYVRAQERELCEKLLEEDLVDRSEITSLTNELARISEVVLILRNEKESLQKELERSEEKSSLLREKLSMAVKKGKGLVQEREGLKISLDEKNSEIEKLKHKLQLQDSAVMEYKEQLKSLSAYPEQFQKLEADIFSIKYQRDEFERILLESNSKLQKLMDSIQCIALPTETVYEEPVEKMNWIADHLHESEVAKALIQKELEKVKEEAMLQANKLEDAAAAIQSLDSELSEAKKNISVIFEEKKDMQLVKTSLEQELEKMKEEGQKQGSKLERAYATIKSLEDSLSRAGDSKTSLEQELDKMKEEGQRQDNKLEHAYATIRSLEDSLSQADNSLSLLEAAKNEIEFRSKQDLSALNAKLAECMEELARSSGSLENQSVELTRNLEHLQVLMKDETLFSLITEEFQTKIERLRNMGLLIQDMHEQFVAKGLHIHLGPENPDFAKLCTLPTFEDYTNDRIVQSGTSAADLDSIPSFAKVVDGFHARAKLVKDRFTGLSKYMDDHVAIAFQAVHAMRDEFIHMLELSASLKLNANNLEAYKQVQQIEMDSLQKQMGKLLSACTDATRALHEFCDLFELDSNAKQHEYNLDLQSKEFSGAQVKEGDASIYVMAAEALSNSAKEFRIGYQQLANSKRMWIASIDDLEEKLKQAELTAETASQDKHLNQERISKLEVDLEALQNVCNKLRSDIEDYRAKEDMLRKNEAEFISSKRTLIAEDTDDKLFSDDQMKTLVDKVNSLEFPLKTSEAEIEEVHFLSPIEKLFYIVDNISELWHRIETMAIEKEDLDLVLASHVHEIENLKKDAATLSSTLQDSESKKAELADLKSGLERIIQSFGGIDSFEDKKSATAKDLLPILEKLMKASSMEYENANSRVQEMASKLLAKENVIDELSEKIKLLEDSIDSRLMQPDTVKERTVFEASTAMGSEISEIEDAGPLTKNTPPVPPAAHSRTTRKGSTDHLVLSIDPESEQLITAQEIDDKGHVFKSLNTSGIIPKQGKLIADRIDGIWVSGGRMLMSRPRARLGLIAYWLLLHLWVLGTIL